MSEQQVQGSDAVSGPAGDIDTATPPGLTGLTAAEVAQRTAAGEVNATESVTSRPLIEIIKANVFTRFNALLGGLFVAVLATGRLADALFGFAAVLNSVFGIAQEWSAKRKLDSLAVLTAPTTHVVRDGVTSQIPSGAVVRGDLVEVRTGDQIPADGPLQAVDGLEIDESNLTGESDPIAKKVGDPVASGTAVVAGRGWFRADVVGADTQAQKLSSEAKKYTRTFSDVQASTNTLLRYLTWVVILALPLTVWTQVKTVGKEGWQEVAVRVAGALVGLIPEGLVLLTTLAFVLASVQLARRKALVQELPAIEGLARVDVICLDKTGTLTLGDIAFEKIVPINSGHGDQEDAAQEKEAEEALGALAHGRNPNATSTAIAAKVADPGWTLREEIPFNSTRKWSAADAGEHGVWILGAPDMLLPSCPDEALRAQVQATLDPLADEGSRVVLLARTQTLPVDGSLGPITPRAMVCLGEQIRPDAEATLNYFKSQDVTVKVISGDNPRTVATIARKVGLDVGEPVDARTMTDDPVELAKLVEHTTVFGRVSPGQKRELVHALQANGHTVAMTGDGVNDVLALKDADIGIAMGNAAPATKAVAQLVLLDGRYANLPVVLGEGRRLIANVERVANLFVAKNIMSLVLIVTTALVGLSFPFLPRQLTLVSTLTIGIPAAILALGPNNRRYVPGFLRRVLGLAIPAGAAAGIASFLTFWAIKDVDVSPDNPLIAGTAALVSVLCVNFWLLVVLARPFRLWKAALIGALVVAVVLCFVLPVGQTFFLLHLELPHLIDALLVGLVGMVVVEIAYRRSRRAHGSSHHPAGAH